MRSDRWPRSREDVGRRLHHPLRAADEGDGPRAVPRRLVEEVGHDADPARATRARPGRRSRRPRRRRAPRAGRARRRTAGRPASGRRSRCGSRRTGARSARRASRSGRSGARPMPPVTTTTSRPTARSTGQPRPSGPRRPSSSPRLETRPAAVVAGPAARIVSSRPSGRKRETEMGGAREAGQVDHDELAGRARRAAPGRGRRGRASPSRPSRGWLGE